MLSVLDLTRVKRLLCLGAHCDDIEIGAGGTILQLAKANPELEVKWVVFAGENPERVEEARRSAEVFLAGTSTKSEIVIHGFRDGFFPFQGELLKETFEDLKSELRAGPHSHPPRRRPAPGPPSRLATDLEHLARPHDPRIRDHEI